MTYILYVIPAPTCIGINVSPVFTSVIINAAVLRL